MTTHKPLELSDANFEEVVLGSDQPVFVDFWAEWCPPCRLLTPTIESLATELQGKAKVGKLNIDENPKTAAEFGISSIPSVLLFKDGKVAETLVGVHPVERYQQAFEELTAVV